MADKSTLLRGILSSHQGRADGSWRGLARDREPRSPRNFGIPSRFAGKTDEKVERGPGLTVRRLFQGVSRGDRGRRNRPDGRGPGIQTEPLPVITWTGVDNDAVADLILNLRTMPVQRQRQGTGGSGYSAIIHAHGQRILRVLEAAFEQCDNKFGCG